MRRKSFALLIDPDKVDPASTASLIGLAVNARVDYLFVGGSLVPAGGHNPLEPARLAVPVMMGPHYENFRDAVELLQNADALRVVERSDVGETIAALLAEPSAAAAMGTRGKKAFEEQAGATQRAVDALMRLLTEGDA